MTKTAFSQVRAAKKVDAGGSVHFTDHLIMAGYAYPYGIGLGDLDGDGDLDITSADATPHNKLYWFENDGKGSFQKHLIQEDDPERLERHWIGDINGDGHPDVAIVKNLAGDLLWFANSGKPRDGQLWKRHVITPGKLPGAYDTVLLDVDRDGDLDVAASSWRLGNQFAWFENDGTPANGDWSKHLIEDNVGETRTIRMADFDGDGDPDLLGTGRVANLVVWYENTSTRTSTAWKKHVIDDQLAKTARRTRIKWLGTRTTVLPSRDPGRNTSFAPLFIGGLRLRPPTWTAMAMWMWWPHRGIRRMDSPGSKTTGTPRGNGRCTC